MKTVLVTGSEGNIGIYLVKRLQQARPDLRILRVDMKEGGNVCAGDLSEASFVKKVFEENIIDYVIHLAARNYNIHDLKSNAYEIYSNDTRCLLNILDNAKHIKKFVYFSSALVYESSKESMLTEESSGPMLPPKSSLGLAKYSGEKAVEFFGRQYGVPYTIWRPFNVVSPLESHEREGAHVFVDFYRKIFIEKSSKILIFGSGQQIKCFLWAEDLAAAISDFVDNEKTNNQIFNIASTEQKTLLDLAKALIHIGKEKNILSEDYSPEIVAEKESLDYTEQQKIPSVEKIKKVLGWEHQTNFTDCFTKFIEYKQHN